MLIGYLVVGKRLAIFFTTMHAAMLPFVPAKVAVVHCMLSFFLFFFEQVTDSPCIWSYVLSKASEAGVPN